MGNKEEILTIIQRWKEDARDGFNIDHSISVRDDLGPVQYDAREEELIFHTVHLHAELSKTNNRPLTIKKIEQVMKGILNKEFRGKSHKERFLLSAHTPELQKLAAGKKVIGTTRYKVTVKFEDWITTPSLIQVGGDELLASYERHEAKQTEKEFFSFSTHDIESMITEDRL